MFWPPYNPDTMTSKSPISRFENFARELVEGSFDRLLGEPALLVQLTGELFRAAEESRQEGLAADHYAVRLHPGTLARLDLDTPEVETGAVLGDLLARLWAREKLVFGGEVDVELFADDSVPEGKIIVSATHSTSRDEPTAVLNRKKGPTAPLRQLDAYLIIGGRRHVVLDKAVNTIGRSLDNDIVLEDPGVSRIHAQIRWRNGRFAIFDLGSRAGTRINGRPYHETDLKSGDVITLGAAALIYGEEDAPLKRTSASAILPGDITQEHSRDDIS